MNPAPGTYEAFLDIMDAAGPYPMTRAEVLDAIRAGVRDAFTEHLNSHPVHAVPATSPTIPAGFRPYGSTTDHGYVERLRAFCDARGYVVIDATWQCLRRLSTPGHDCVNADDHWRAFNWRTLDHLVRLKARDGSRWALLGQPYDLEPADADQLVDVAGADRWELCGPAPYGHGTHAVLIVGRTEESR